MLRSVFGVVVALAVFAGSAVSQDKDKDKDKSTKASITKTDATQGDQEKIQGTWKLVSADAANIKPADKAVGEKALKLSNLKLIITKDKMMHQVFGKVGDIGETYKLDPTRKPKWIDVKTENWTKLGIYELEGDHLKIGLGYADGKERPTDFVLKPQSPLYEVIILKREKP